MGNELVDLAPLVGGGSVFSVLVAVIWILLRSQSADHAQRQQAIKDAEERADAAEARERTVRAEAAEREKVLQDQVDDAISRRRKAEDLYAQVLLELRELKAKVSRMEAELARFTAGGP